MLQYQLYHVFNLPVSRVLGYVSVDELGEKFMAPGLIIFIIWIVKLALLLFLFHIF
jgi:hypothetical protein